MRTCRYAWALPRAWNGRHLPVSLMGVLSALIFGIASATAAPPQAVIERHLPDTMLPLEIEEVIYEDGQLIAIGSLGDETFALPLDLSTRPSDGECPILDLALGPINLDLLGLNVDTSPICLAITADEGGGLLGDLLCAVAGLLDGGVELGDILDSLTEEELDVLLDGIRDLLNLALDEILAPTSVAGISSSQDEGIVLQQAALDCDILNLSLGPVELNLLGLVVELDDCDGGPVTVDITAEPGPGNLLGNLLCGVARLLDNGASPVAVASALNRVADAILDLL